MYKTVLNRDVCNACEQVNPRETYRILINIYICTISLSQSAQFIKTDYFFRSYIYFFDCAHTKSVSQCMFACRKHAVGRRSVRVVRDLPVHDARGGNCLTPHTRAQSDRMFGVFNKKKTNYTKLEFKHEIV